MEKHSLSSEATVSIILCCHNSVPRLRPTLKHITCMLAERFRIIEVILVDNNSTDNTADYSKALWDEFGNPFPLSVVYESRQGLAWARLCGVNHASGTYTIFCDDDNWLDSDYADIAVSFLENHSDIGILGGVSTPCFECPPPSWFYSYADYFAVGNPLITSGYVTSRKYVWGAGMTLRTSVLQSCYKSVLPLVSGRIGKALSSGDDGEICAWFIFKKYKLYVHSGCKFRHFMSSNRLTTDYIVNFRRSNAFSLWSVYNAFLTVRYFLFPLNYNGIITRFVYATLIYFRSFSVLLLHPISSYRILLIHFKLSSPHYH